MSLRNDIVKGIHNSVKTIKLSEGYDTAFKEVSDLVVNLADLPKRKTPLLEVVDAGNEEVLVETDTKQLYGWNLVLRASTKVKDGYVTEEINKLLSSVKQWCYSVTPSDIHDNVTGVQFLEVSASGLIENTTYAAVETQVRIIYYTNGDY